MEREAFISGYCRQLDGSRMVAVFIADGQLEECDCAYAACPYAPNCPTAQRIEALLAEQ